MYRLLISCGLVSLSMTYKLDFPSSTNTLMGSGAAEDVIPYRQAFSPSSVRRFKQNTETYQIEQKNIPQPLKDNPEIYWLVNSSPLFRNARNWHLNVEKKNIQQQQPDLREDGYWNLLRKELYRPAKSYIGWTNQLQTQNRTPMTIMPGLNNQIGKSQNKNKQHDSSIQQKKKNQPTPIEITLQEVPLFKEHAKPTSQPNIQTVAEKQIQLQINQNQMPELELIADLGDGSGALLLQNVKGQSN